jgi:hypothetical protein
MILFQIAGPRLKMDPPHEKIDRPRPKPDPPQRKVIAPRVGTVFCQ